MRIVLSIICGAWLVCGCYGTWAAEGYDPDFVWPEDKAPKPIPEGQIRLPVLPPGPTPTPPTPSPNPEPIPPAPVPTEVTTLQADQFFVIEADVPFFVLDSRTGFVSIAYDEGPIRLRGKFADGTSKVETRTYESKYLATLEATQKGQVEILVVPAGATDAGVVIRRTLSVMGQAPQPPPGPDPPQPDPPTPTGKVFVAIVEDAMNRSPDASIVLGALIGWHEFVDKGNQWRLYDTSTGESRGKKAISDSEGLPVPYMVIYDEKGEKIRAQALPKTFAKLKEVLSGT